MLMYEEPQEVHHERGGELLGEHLGGELQFRGSKGLFLFQEFPQENL